MTEEDTPFKPSVGQRLFRNAANVQLRGTTYDARHMDKFIDSSFGEKSVQLDASGIPVQQTLSSMSRIQQGYSAYLTSMKTTSNPHALSSHVSSAIKPSVCFLNLPREAAKIHGTPPDMIDGPSPLQKLGNEITLKDRFTKTVFEVEREEHEGVKPEKIGSLHEARSSLFLTLEGQQPQLKSPKE